MKISDIIRSTLDLIDPGTVPVKKIQVVVQPVEYANTPGEQIADIDRVLADGDDVNKSKHPSDIRSNSVSMYPGHQSRP